jgi:hypothetical protein
MDRKKSKKTIAETGLEEGMHACNHTYIFPTDSLFAYANNTMCQGFFFFFTFSRPRITFTLTQLMGPKVVKENNFYTLHGR